MPCLALALGAVPARIRATTHFALNCWNSLAAAELRFDVLDRMLRALDKMTGFGGLNRALALRARLDNIDPLATTPKFGV